MSTDLRSQGISLDDVLDASLLAEMVEGGYVNEQRHPSALLAVLNYSKRAQFDRVWNDVTRRCRGLIYNAITREIVARPWPKFHNYGEHEEGSLDLEAPVRVTDKLDGSLGILYPLGSDRWAIATRGSFTSEQAQHATAIWNERYAASAHVDPSLTHLFEIIYPENRIVVDYAGLDDLVLLGTVENATGLPGEDPTWWNGPCADTLDCNSLATALELPPRQNAEGVVVQFAETGEMLKLKQDDYVALHRLVTGLNERTVWEHLGAGGKINELCEPLPDEFHDWVRDVAEGLILQATLIQDSAQADFEEIRNLPDRKAFALAANESEYRPYLFMLLDGKDPWGAIWRTLRPTRPKTLVDASEDVA